MQILFDWTNFTAYFLAQTSPSGGFGGGHEYFLFNIFIKSFSN